MRKIFLVSIVFILLLSFWACGGSRSASINTTLDESQADKIITAVGHSALPTDVQNKAQARLMAIRAAEVDAYRNLAEKIHGLTVFGNTTVKDRMAKDDNIRTMVNGFVKNAKMKGEPQEKNGTYEVTLEIYLGKEFSKVVMKKDK